MYTSNCPCTLISQFEPRGKFEEKNYALYVHFQFSVYPKQSLRDSNGFPA